MTVSCALSIELNTLCFANGIGILVWVVKVLVVKLEWFVRAYNVCVSVRYVYGCAWGAVHIVYINVDRLTTTPLPERTSP